MQGAGAGIKSLVRLVLGALHLKPIKLGCDRAHKFFGELVLGLEGLVQRRSYGWFTDRSREVAEAVQLARGAAEVGGDDALTLSRAAHAITTLAGDADSGAALIEQALLSNRHLAAAWYVSGWAQLQPGKPQSAVEHLVHALRLSPCDPLIFKVYAAVAYAHFLEGRYDDGAKCAERAALMQPHYQTALRAAAASHALAGRLGLAHGDYAPTRSCPQAFAP